MLKVNLAVEVEYNENRTSPEALADALSILLATALSTPDVLDEHGNPTVGQFSVAETETDAIYNALTEKLTQEPFGDDDMRKAEKIAKRLGFTQTAYTTSSALWGLFCLPDRPTQKKGCITKTKELGLLFVQDVEDMLMEDLREGA